MVVVVAVVKVVKVKFILGKLGFIELFKANNKLPFLARAGGNGGGKTVEVVVLDANGFGDGAAVGVFKPRIAEGDGSKGWCEGDGVWIMREEGEDVCCMRAEGEGGCILLGPPQLITHSSIVSKLFSLPEKYKENNEYVC